ncbi:hypothetical protein DF034_14450 [Burkholderia anthina]|nr:hypothetical protein DF034_14450 [Burkholderia anthina]
MFYIPRHVLSVRICHIFRHVTLSNIKLSLQAERIQNQISCVAMKTKSFAHIEHGRQSGCGFLQVSPLVEQLMPHVYHLNFATLYSVVEVKFMTQLIIDKFKCFVRRNRFVVNEYNFIVSAPLHLSHLYSVDAPPLPR